MKMVWAAMFVLCAAMLGGCTSGTNGSGSTPTTKAASGPTESASALSGLQTAVAVTTVDATIAASYGPPLVKVVELGGKRIFTDTSGMTLYFFADDVITSGVSACGSGECEQTWPPLLATLRLGFQIAGLGPFGEFQRDAGHQVEYRGRPLYRYSGDHAAGDTNGDGVDGKWSIAVP